MKRAFLLVGTFVLTACAGLPSPVRRTPMATPVVRLEDRPIALRFPRYGPLFVQFGDRTIGNIATWSSGKATLVWRTPYPVRDFQAYTNMVCVLTDDGDAGCLSSEPKLEPLKPRLHEPTAKTIALALGFELCITTETGETRCEQNRTRLTDQDAAEKMYAGLGKLKKIVHLTPCGIDLQDRLVCAPNRPPEPPKIVLEGVRDASLLSTGAMTVAGCALLLNGTVSCFGSNQDGELGIGRRGDVGGPVVVPGLTDVVRISHAPGKTCAIRADGALFCWGARFGVDGLRAAAALPRCKTETRTVKVEPCPQTDGDNPCERGRWNARRSGDDLEHVTHVTRDPEGQCVAPGEAPYAASPVRFSLAPSALDVSADDRRVFALRSDGVVIVTGESEEYDENAISPVPNDPRLHR